MKIIFLGIFFVCLNTLSGSSFDSITKYLSINSLKWYHFYSIGGIFALIFYLDVCIEYTLYKDKVFNNIYFNDYYIYN